jgi:hypothetical protein
VKPISSLEEFNGGNCSSAFVFIHSSNRRYDENARFVGVYQSVVAEIIAERNRRAAAIRVAIASSSELKSLAPQEQDICDNLFA